MAQLISYVQLLLLSLANGALALSYVAWENLAALGTLAAFLACSWRAPTVQRGAIVAAGGVAVLAAAFAPPPVPVLLLAMAGIGVLAVAYDRFNLDALRWRVVGALALYAAGALAYLAYSTYLSGVDAAAWAEVIGGQAEAQTTLAQGRAFLNTLATWGL